MLNPITISLLNHRLQPILFIPDGAQDLLIEVENDSGEPVDFDTTQQFHLRLLFRPKTLRDPQSLKLVTDTDALAEDSDLHAAALESKNWTVVTDNIPGPIQGMGSFVTVDLKAKARPALPNGQRLLLLLAGATPDINGQGTRLSKVEIQHTLVPGLPLPGVAYLHLLNISEFAYLAEERDNDINSARSLPFAAAFGGSNQVLNDGVTQSTLTVQIFNIQDAPLNVSEKSQLEIAWFLTGSPGALTDPGKVTLESPTNSFWKPVDNITEISGTGSRKLIPASTSAPFARNTASTVNITLTIPPTIPAGFAPLMLSWSNLPDSPDGKLTLLVEITSLIVDKTGWVGVGTTAPRSRLEVQTNNVGETTLLTLTNTAGHTGTSAALDFNTYPTHGNPTARIEAVDDGNSSNNIRFLTNKPGAQNDGLVERLKIGSDGSLFLNGKPPFFFKLFSFLAATANIPTGYYSTDYYAVVTSFLQEASGPGQVIVKVQIPDNQWLINTFPGAGASTTVVNWSVNVLFIRRELVDVHGSTVYLG